MAEELVFETVDLEDFRKVYKYMSVFGEGSCQHSFVSMYSTVEKYGDAVCEEDGFLYTLRRKLCDERFRTYLAPMGEGDLRQAFSRIIADAHRHRRRVEFVTLTEKYAAFLEKEFPGQFAIEEDRDLAEYLYRTEKMAAFPGRKLKKRREEVNHFWRLFGERASVFRMRQTDFPEILDFENLWVQNSRETHDGEALEREERMIRRQLAHFDELALSGIVLRIDGSVKGFGYGTRLSNICYDAIIEKGDRDIPHIYKVLRQESVKQCAMDCTYVNMEEDVGVPGLRALKYAYQPEFLLHKYIAAEK